MNMMDTGFANGWIFLANAVHAPPSAGHTYNADAALAADNLIPSAGNSVRLNADISTIDIIAIIANNIVGFIDTHPFL